MHETRHELQGAVSQTAPVSSLAPQDPAPARSRFLSEADCRAIEQRLQRYASEGGETNVHIVSRWRGHVRWARNRIVSTGEDRDNRVTLGRTIRGAREENRVVINEVSDVALVAAVRRVERLLGMDRELFDSDVDKRTDSPFLFQNEPAAEPKLFYQSTYQLGPPQRAKIARQLTQQAVAAGMLAAGYVEATSTSFAYLTSWGCTRYYEYTWAQCSMTVRDPTGIGSGWAGVDWPDWNKIDGTKLSVIALDKCLKSRNPVTVEPGRYTTILEPQAVADFLRPWGMHDYRQLEEITASQWLHGTGEKEPLFTSRGEVPKLGVARFGEKVIDERLTLSSDPLESALGFAPYSKLQISYSTGEVYHPVTWIEQGVLKALPYSRRWGIEHLGQDAGLPASGALHMSVVGPTNTVEEMIAATKRGLLVTRFDMVGGPVSGTLICAGYTRDGLWLIENGKISKPVRNLRFVESIVFALNNVELVGESQRTFNPLSGWVEEWSLNPAPMVMPALKIRDFSFTALSNAI